VSSVSNQGYIKVFSHPRSGTHFLEAVLFENFYLGHDLHIPDVKWGHWSNRQEKKEGNPFGKLFGSHVFPTEVKRIDYPAIYIFRDPRAVAYSIWKTPNFIHPSLKDLPFSEFLREKIDWIGSPAFKCRKKFTLIQHWERHVDGWLKIVERSELMLDVKYEELVINPESIVNEISEAFNLDLPEKIKLVKSPLGLLPNKAEVSSWKEMASIEDEEYIYDSIKSRKLKNLFFESSSHN
jgi:bile-salt sulfotransferase